MLEVNQWLSAKDGFKLKNWKNRGTDLIEDKFLFPRAIAAVGGAIVVVVVLLVVAIVVVMLTCSPVQLGLSEPSRPLGLSETSAVVVGCDNAVVRPLRPSVVMQWCIKFSAVV